MIVRNGLFKFSSLCIIGSVTILVNQFLPGLTGGNRFVDTSVNSGESAMYADGTSIIEGETASNQSPVGEEVLTPVEEEQVPGEAVPEDTAEATEVEAEATEEPAADENAIPGIDYKVYMKKNDYSNLGIANVTGYLNVRKDASSASSENIIAKMPPNAGCTILETITNDAGEVWCKIESGNVTGYVMKEYLITGDMAKSMVAKYGHLVITVTCDVLNLRESASTDAAVLYQVQKNESLKVAAVTDQWVEVNTDLGTDTGFVAREFVDFSFELEKAIEVDELLVGCSTTRTQMVNFAKKFLGNKYVYGGTDLYNGIDCSAYVQAIYKEFGHTLPRTSGEQADTSSVGKVITEEQLLPGDLVFYANSSGRVKHVAMFIGNGKIIHASNPRDGIKISNMKYSKPFRYKNILGDL